MHITQTPDKKNSFSLVKKIESLLFCAVDNALDGEGLNDADNYPGFWEGRVMNNISFIRRGEPSKFLG